MDVRKSVVLRVERFSAALEPVDFLERIRIAMGVDGSVALAYKWYNDPATVPAHSLTTPDDVKMLIAENTRRKLAWCTGNRPVKISIINLVRASFAALGDSNPVSVILGSGDGTLHDLIHLCS